MKGILVAPGDGAFNSRRAIQVGSHNINAANANVKFSVRLDGQDQHWRTDTPGTILEVSGSEANTQIGAGDLAAFKIANTNHLAGAHLNAEIQFGASDTTRFAARLEASYAMRTGNTAGEIWSLEFAQVQPTPEPHRRHYDTHPHSGVAAVPEISCLSSTLRKTWVPALSAGGTLHALLSGIVTPRLAAAGATGTNQAVAFDGSGRGAEPERDPGKGGVMSSLTTSPSIASGLRPFKRLSSASSLIALRASSLADADRCGRLSRLRCRQAQQARRFHQRDGPGIQWRGSAVTDARASLVGNINKTRKRLLALSRRPQKPRL